MTFNEYLTEKILKQLPEERNPVIFAEVPTSSEIGKSNYNAGWNACREQMMVNLEGFLKPVEVVK